MAKSAAHFTVRGVPARVAKALKKKAALLNTSLNCVLLQALEAAVGLGSRPSEQHDLDHYSGTWVEEPKVERALAEQRRIDPRD